MKAFLNWSGGKDSAFCLYKAQQYGIPVEALVTSVNESNDRISMHGVRRSLLEQQAAAVGLPLFTVEVPQHPGMKTYEHAIRESNQMLREIGFTHVLSGDLYLEDLKAYRTALYAKDDITTIYPLWKMDTGTLLKDFWEEGFKAIVVVVNGSLLDKSFCGRMLDTSFVQELPISTDVCGEQGEYHSFVFDGPIFSKEVCFTKGDMLYQEYPAPRNTDSDTQIQTKAVIRFYSCDILPCLRK